MRACEFGGVRLRAGGAFAPFRAPPKLSSVAPALLPPPPPANPTAAAEVLDRTPETPLASARVIPGAVALPRDQSGIALLGACELSLAPAATAAAPKVLP